MVGLDLIRSILKVCHEEELSILPSSCCFNSRWALCSKRFWGLVCLVIYLLFYLWVGKVHNGFTGVEESLSVLCSGRFVSQLLIVFPVLFVILKNLSSFTSLL